MVVTPSRSRMPPKRSRDSVTALPGGGKRRGRGGDDGSGVRSGGASARGRSDAKVTAGRPTKARRTTAPVAAAVAGKATGASSDEFVNEYSGWTLGPKTVISRVPYDSVTPEQFFATYVAKRRPCVLVGYVSSGVASTRASVAVLRLGAMMCVAGIHRKQTAGWHLPSGRCCPGVVFRRRCC
jgi:hypothetical protein